MIANETKCIPKRLGVGTVRRRETRGFFNCLSADWFLVPLAFPVTSFAQMASSTVNNNTLDLCWCFQTKDFSSECEGSAIQTRRH